MPEGQMSKAGLHKLAYVLLVVLMFYISLRGGV